MFVYRRVPHWWKHRASFQPPGARYGWASRRHRWECGAVQAVKDEGMPTFKNPLPGLPADPAGRIIPWLRVLVVLGSTLPTIDPQLRGIIRRINFWKRFFRTFPRYKEEFLKAVASSGLSKYTPCGSFRVSLQDIGWHCLPDGFVMSKASPFSGLSNPVNIATKWCLELGLIMSWKRLVIEKGLIWPPMIFPSWIKSYKPKLHKNKPFFVLILQGFILHLMSSANFQKLLLWIVRTVMHQTAGSIDWFFAKLWRNTGRHLMLHFSGWPINRELPHIMVCALIMIIGSKLKQANKEIGFHLPSLLVMTKHFLFSRMVPLIPNSSGSTRPQVVLWLSWILSWVSNV